MGTNQLLFNNLKLRLAAFAACSFLFSTILSAQQANLAVKANTEESPDIQKLLQYYDKQIYFTENKGQWPVNVLYKADFHLGQAIATKEGMIVGTFDPASIAARSAEVMKQEKAEKAGHPYKLSKGSIKGHGWLMNFVNHSLSMSVETKQKHKDNFNYVQMDNSKQIMNANNYQEVWYKNVYDKVDVRYYPSATGTLEYDIVCKPGFNKNDIAINYQGIEKVTLKKDGGLILKTSVGDMDFPAPVAYQKINGKQIIVKAKYKLVGDNEITFALGKYNADQPLIIDPIALRWATWITNNSDGDDHGHCIWVYVDPVTGYHSIYVAARILGSGLITVNAFDNSYNGPANESSDDIVLGKYLEPDTVGGSGSRVWQTYYGGHDEDNPYAMEQGPDGNMYVTGLTASANFPMSGGTKFSSEPSGIDDRSQGTGGSNDFDNIFVLKFDTSGTSFKAAVIGGNGNDDPFDLRITKYGDILVCGYTNSTNLGSVLPSTGATNGDNGGLDIFVFKINSLLDSVYWFKNYGGSAEDEANIMLTDPTSGNIFVAGQTKSTDFPTINPRQGSRTGSQDGIIQKLDSNGNILWSSYFNSGKNDSTSILCMEFNTTHDRLYFGGVTLGLASSNIGIAADTLSNDTSYNGGNADFFVGLMDTAQNLVKATYLGGKGSEINMMGLNVDQNNDVYIFGYSNSNNFPITADALQSDLNHGAGGNASSSDHDKTFTKLRSDLDSVIYSTYYGGGQDDYDPVGERGIKFSQCRIYTIVTAISNNIPLTAGAITTNKKSGSTTNNGVYEPGLVVWANPPDFNNNTISGNQVLCSGSTPSDLTGSKPTYELPNISRNGNVTAYPVTFDSVYTFEWQSSTDQVLWTDIPGGNTQNLSGSLIHATSDTTYFRRIINGDACIGVGISDQIVVLQKFDVKGTVVNANCQGENNGSITLNVINGTAPFQYAWSPGGATTSSLSNLHGGTYKVVVTDANGCHTDTTPFTVGQPANPLTATPSSTPANCNQSNGSVSVSASGGTSPYTYQWSSGQTTTSVSGLAANTYTVTVTDSNQCFVTAPDTIQNVAGPSANAGPDTSISCLNGSQVTLNGSSSDGSATFSWVASAGGNIVSGANTATPTVNAAGIYTLTVSDAATGCTATDAVTVTSDITPPPVNITPQSSTTFCQGGSVQLCASGANTYIWSPTDETSSCITVSTGGTYSVTGTAANGCSATASIPVTVYIATTGDTTASACGSFTWYGVTYTASTSIPTQVFTGGNANGCDSTVILHLTIDNPTTGDTTASACNSFTWYGVTYTASTSTPTHTLTGGNANGCDSTVTLNLTINNPTTGDTTVSACNSFTWYGTTYTSSTSAPIHVLSGGNANGCDSTVTLNLTINYSSSSTSTIIECDSYTWNGVTYTASTSVTDHFTNAVGCDSAATLNLTINYSTTSTNPVSACDSYTWNNITYTSSTSVTTHSTNAAGCDSAATLNLTVNYSTTSTTTLSECNSFTWNSVTYTSSTSVTHHFTNAAGCDSAATLNLTINYNTTGDTTASACNSFIWYGTTYTLSTSAPKHVLKGGNSNGCDSTITLNLTINNSNTGDTTASACNSFTWYGITYTANASATHTFLNAAGCDSVVTLTLSVTQTPNVKINTPGGTTLCIGQGVAGITLCASGANTYLWSTGETTTCITVTGSNTFSVVGTVNGCSASNFVKTTANTPPVVSCSLSQTLGNDTAIVSGGTGSYAYAWSTGATTSVITITSAGTYSVLVTDKGSGCTGTCSTVISCTTPSCDISGNTSICNGQSTPLCGPSGDGYHYLWSTGETTRCITISSPATYSLTVTVNGGCSSTCTKCVTLSANPNCSISTGCGGNFTCDPNGTSLCGPDGYSYVWSTGATTQCIHVKTTGSYSLTVTNRAGCSCTCSKYITIGTPPSCDISGPSSICNGQCASLCAPSGDGLKYSWSTGATTQCIMVHNSGTYYVTVTNRSGCSNTCSKCVTVSSPPSCSISTGCGGNYTCDPSGTSLCGPDGPYSYVWSTGATTQCIHVYATGSYTLTVTNRAGCSCSCSKYITIGTMPSCDISGPSGICDGQSATLCAPSGDGYTYSWSNHATTKCITIRRAGTYYVTVTGPGGCSSTCSKCVVVNSVPNCTIYTSCNGNMSCESHVTLCGPGGCDQYAWSTGATTQCITVTATGTYTLTVTNHSGCSSTCCKYITIGTPPSCTISGGSSICNGQSIPLCAPQGQGYSYSWSTGATTSCISVSNSGTYSVTVTNNSGCSSTCMHAVNVNQSSSGDTSATACNSFSWYGTVYTQSTTATHVFNNSNANGCDSTVTLHLTINYPTFGDTAAVACSSFSWYGVTYTASGQPTHLFLGGNANSCDSTVTLRLVINYPSSSDSSITACGSLLVGDSLYTQSTILSTVLPGGNSLGCDSTFNLHLIIINGGGTGDTTATACSSFSWYGQIYTASADDLIHIFSNVGNVGCDSTLRLHLTINQPTTGDTTATACSSFSWYGTTYSASTDDATYVITGGNAVGCDSTVTLHLTINQPTFGDTSAAACVSFTWYGVTYTASTDAPTQVFPAGNSVGCDSTVTLHLVINPPTFGDTTATACNSFSWYGVTYSASTDEPTQVFPGANANGCDSTVTLHLTINNPTFGDTTATACVSFTWYGVTYTSSTDEPTQFFPGGNSVGCDSTVRLNLTINNPSFSDTAITACSSILLYDSVYTQSTTITQVLSGGNAVGCDSTVSVFLTINNPSFGDTLVTACNSFTWNGVTYTASTDVPTEVFPGGNVNGCDSTVTLVLTINYSDTSYTPVTNCNSFVWNNQTYTASGTYSAFLAGGNAAGCDSTAFLVLTINYSDTTKSSATACGFYKLPWEQLAMSSGEYSFTYENVSGCDSVVIIDVTINHGSMSDTTVTACNSYTWNNTTYTLSGTYSVSFPGGNINKCDSSAALHLTINYSDTSRTSVTACNFYVWNDHNYTTGGTYSKFFPGGNAAGCDSTAYLALTINYSDTSHTSFTACNSYIWNGQTYTVSGTYSAFFPGGNSVGCDSTAFLVLTINYPPTVHINTNGSTTLCGLASSVQLCASGASTYVWSDGETTTCITVSSAGTYSVTGTDSSGTCSSDTSVHISSGQPLNIVITVQGNTLCQGGSAQLCATGNYTFLWSPSGETTTCINVNSAGTYTVTGTDPASGCSGTDTITITPVAPPSCNITGKTNICDGESTRLCAPDGLTYSWSTGATTQCITVRRAGTYSLTVTNGNGCSSTCTACVMVSSVPNCCITTGCGSDYTCDGRGTSLCGPNGCDRYRWSTGATTQCIHVNTSGTYSLTVYNKNGCSSTCSKCIYINTPPPCHITGKTRFCEGECNSLCGPDGDGLRYSWSTGEHKQCIMVHRSGTYYLTVTNRNGCSSTCEVCVTAYPAPSSCISGNLCIKRGQCTTLCVTNCDKSDRVTWSDGETTRCITVRCEGRYCVTVCNGSGCSSSSCVCVVYQNSCTRTDGSPDNDPTNSYGNIDVNAYPNPFTTVATVEFRKTDESSHVRVEVYTLDGAKVATLFDAQAEAGTVYKATFDATNLSEGMYIYKIITDDNVVNGKLMLVKH